MYRWGGGGWERGCGGVWGGLSGDFGLFFRRDFVCGLVVGSFGCFSRGVFAAVRLGGGALRFVIRYCFFGLSS